MPFSHSTGLHNIQATLFAWLRAALTSNPPPAVPQVQLALDHPASTLAAPLWSAHVSGTANSTSFYDATQRFGLLEVNCWVTRSDPGWRAQLAQMLDAVTLAAQTLLSEGGGLAIKDFYSDPAAPPDTNARLSVTRIEQPPTPHDSTANLVHGRVVLHFHWFERAEVGS